MSHTLRNCLVSLFCLSLLLGIGCQREGDQEQSNQEQSNNSPAENGSAMNWNKTSYGKLADDREVDLYTCTNANGATSDYDSKTLYTHILVHLIKSGRY